MSKESTYIINNEVILALGKGVFIDDVGRECLIDEKESIKCLTES